MIRQREIQNIAESLNLPKSTIDKDWVLGHFLSAIYTQKELKDILIFKGGTSLKKCYFYNYRFSEDLDFTSINSEFILSRTIVENICSHLKEKNDILTNIIEVNPLTHNNKIMGYKSVIGFWGADHSKNQEPPPPERWTTSVKIEISTQEIIEFNTDHREINHPYSDELEITKVPCYSLEEIITEKLRALIQRSYTAPRDYFDLVYLFDKHKDLDLTIIKSSFLKKMAHKNLPFTGIDQMINERNDKTISAAWNNSLKHQIPAKYLTDYVTIRNKLSKRLSFLH